MRKVGLTDTLKKERDPRTRVYLLLAEAEAQMRPDAQKSLQLSHQAIDEARTNRMKDIVAPALAMAGKSSFIREDRRKAAEYFKQALKIYQSLGDMDAALEMEFELASTKLTTGNESLTLVQLLRILHERTHTPYQGPASRKEQSTIRSAGQEGTRFFIPRTWEDRVLKRIPSPTQIERNQRMQLGALYNSLGIAYIVIREHHKAASFLEEELAIFKSLNDRPRIANTLNNLGYIHALLGNNVLALEYSQQGLKLSRQLQDKRGVAINQRNLAQLYLTTGPASLGKRFAMRSFQTATEIGMPELACRALVLLTKYERLHGSLTKSASLNAKALRLLNNGDKGRQYLFFSLQQVLIEHARQPSRSVYPKLLRLHGAARAKGLELHHEIAQEIARVTEELHLLPEAVRWFKRVQEYEIQRLNTEQRSALVSLQTEQELERLAKERELQKLQMDKLEMELNAKARETQLLAVHLAKKGSVLATLTDQLATMKSSNPQYSQETIDAVVELIETIRHKDKEYEHLEERAEALHHEFIVSLSHHFPELTAAEKRICILLKLGLSSIDIANVLFTSVRTIETHCLSIRKKLRIPSSTRLSKFLIAFEAA